MKIFSFLIVVIISIFIYSESLSQGAKTETIKMTFFDSETKHGVVPDEIRFYDEDGYKYVYLF